MGTWVVLIIVAGVFLAIAGGAIGRGKAQIQGRDHCEHCKSRLKKDGNHFAGTCRKCGRQQSWA